MFWQRLFEVLAEEIDNIIYFFLALILIGIAVWAKPADWIQGMITGLFAACLIKVKGGETISKVAKAVRDIAVSHESRSAIGTVVGGVKDILK